MDRDTMFWNEAALIQRDHGAAAARWVGERTVAAKLAGDDVEVARLREVAVRLDCVLAGENYG